MLQRAFKYLFPVAIAGALFFTPSVSHAQVWKNLGKKLEEKIESEASRRAERKLDQAIDKGFDKVEGAADDAVRGNRAGKLDLEAMMGAMSTTATLKDQYEFETGVQYKTTVSGDEKNQSVMTMWFSKDPYVGMEATDGKEQMLSVLDEGQIVIFLQNEKTYMAIGSAVFEAMGQVVGQHVENVEDSNEKFTMTRLADERVLGHLCKVYQVKGDEGETKLWYTQELGVNMLDGFVKSISTLTRQNLHMDIPQGMEEMSGVMLKMESKDLQSGETTIMEATEIRRDGMKIKSADYKRAGG